MIKQKFKNITVDDFSVYPIKLREVLVNELHRAYDKSDDLTVPILDAIENMLKEVDYNLSNIVRSSGMYSIYKYDNHYAVNYIENKPNKTPDRRDDIAYVFSEESFYNKSILYFILQSYGHNLTVMEYLEQYFSGRPVALPDKQR